MLLKLANMLIVWPLEFFMFLVEFYMKKNLERAGLQNNHKNESKRRKDYGLKYLKVAYITFSIMVVAVAILCFVIERQ